MNATSHSQHPTRGLRRLAAFAALVLGATGCDQGADAPEVKAAFERLTVALKDADATAVWDLTDSATRTSLLATADRVMASAPIIETMWGDLRGADASRALDAVAFGAFEQGGAADQGRGPRLVAAFIDFGALRWTEGSVEALKHPTIVMDDSTPLRAIVRVPSGESFVFEKDGDVWTSTLVRLGTSESPRFKGVLANLDKLSAYKEELDRSWRASIDATTPQGAYNLMRRAIADSSDGPAAIFQMIDEDTRGMFRSALELGRKAQRRIQQRTPRAQRPTAYEATGIQLTVEAKTDQELFVAWYRQNALAAEIANDPPASFQFEATDDDSKNTGQVLTVSGREWPVAKRQDGFWVTTILLEQVRTTLLKPLVDAEEAAAK